MALTDLSDLNALIAHAGDPRPWVSLTRREICTNCGNEHRASPIPMREEKKGHYVKSRDIPPSGITFKEVDQPCYFAWCEKCNAERPLAESLTKAIAAASNDRDLAQRVGHIVADFFNRRKLGGTGS